MKRLILFAAMAVFLAGCAGNGVRIATPDGKIVLTPLSENVVRVQMTGELDVPELEELIYDAKPARVRYSVTKKAGVTALKTAGMSVEYDAESGLLTFFDADGKVLLRESGRKVTGNVVGEMSCYDVTEVFDSPEGEFLYGTGQFQDGFLNIKGLTRRLTQVNTQISIPMVLSSEGYALLWHNYGLTDFNPASECITLESLDVAGDSQTVNATGTSGNRRETRFFCGFGGELDVPESGKYALMLDMGQSMSRKQYLEIDGNTVLDINNTWLPPTTSTIVELEAGAHEIFVEGVRGDAPKLFWRLSDNTTTFHSPVATGLDYTVFAGTADECIASYRQLTGEVPQMPKWMFGYIHCRERYTSSDDILENAAGFKEREIPLDVIVQDWQWWGKYGWNALRFDEDHYPDPKALTDSLHKDNVHLMLSVWSKVDRNSEAGKDLEANGCYIDGTDWIDFFKPEAAEYYRNCFLDSLGRYGIDAWWFDATEPENDDLAGRLIGPDALPGEFYRNVYPLFVNRTMYGGLKTLSDDEPVILTRSAFAGIQRYGVVTWSGDVGNDLETLRRQVAGGLGQMASGLPWWTFDAGGFFRPWEQYTDEAYQERMLRWLQVSVFLPFMRVHGYMSRTEPWRYSENTERIFRKCIEQRKALEPYILECARRVSEEGWTMMRPLIFDFPDDAEALKQDCEYMFGTDYLVCPVLKEGVSEWSVYLPNRNGGWEDTRDGKRYDGGQYVTVSVDLEAIPVFRAL
ncbi:MAG: DUF4968 domain-containing protein [Bacteroidales bacterium]|nr:DUF4968 domain-containing protein [Bacteroidales bacterium]